MYGKINWHSYCSIIKRLYLKTPGKRDFIKTLPGEKMHVNEFSLQK